MMKEIIIVKDGNIKGIVKISQTISTISRSINYELTVVLLIIS